MGELLAVLGTLVVVALALWAWRRASVAAEPGPSRSAWSEEGAPSARIVLDLGAVDPELPSVRRLVHEAAHRALIADPSIDEVEVVDREGRSLARERRPEPLPPDVAVPDTLRGMHAPSRHGPSPVPRGAVAHPRTIPGAAPEVRAVPLADRLDLDPNVRARIENPDDGPGVVQAILEIGGRTVTRSGDLLRTGDVAVAVVDVYGNAEQALNHGFLRIQATDAARGIVIRLGYVDPATVRRREAAARHVRHVGPDALQRMADAAAAGADPIAFAAGPATVA